MAGKRQKSERRTSYFGPYLKQWRTTRKLPLKHVARDLGVSVSLISCWERGTRFPRQEQLEDLSGYLRVPLCAFFQPDTCVCPVRHKKGGCLNDSQAAGPDAGRARAIGKRDSRKIEELLDLINCPNGLKCASSGFADLCRARRFAGGYHLECLEKEDPACLFAVVCNHSAEKFRLCTCPVRVFLAQNLMK